MGEVVALQTLCRDSRPQPLEAFQGCAIHRNQVIHSESRAAIHPKHAISRGDATSGRNTLGLSLRRVVAQDGYIGPNWRRERLEGGSVDKKEVR